MNHLERKPSRFAISLRTILLFSSAVFIIGYQQYQLRQMQDSLADVRQGAEDMRQQLKQMQTQTIKVISTTVPGGQGQLRFPIEVERAMMGDGLQPGATIPLTPQRIR